MINYTTYFNIFTFQLTMTLYSVIAFCILFVIITTIVDFVTVINSDSNPTTAMWIWSKWLMFKLFKVIVSQKDNDFYIGRRIFICSPSYTGQRYLSFAEATKDAQILFKQITDNDPTRKQVVEVLK